MACEEIPVVNTFQSPDFGVVQLHSVSCESLREAQQRYSVWTAGQVSHPGVVAVYEVYEPLCDQGRWTAGYLAQAVGSSLAAELAARKAAGRTWSEQEILWVLRCAVDALSHAEQMNWSHCRVSLATIYAGQDRMMLAPFFRTTLSSVYHSCYAYLSPELKTACVAGSLGGVSLAKADMYALGIVLLTLATMSLPEDHQVLPSLATLTGFPILQNFLTRMLSVNPADRPSFQELETEFQALQQGYQRSGGEDIQASLRPSQTARPLFCAVCSCKVTPWDCTSLPASLRLFENFKGNCCSLVCLERFKELALETSLRTNLKHPAVEVVQDVLTCLVVPFAFQKFCKWLPALAPVFREVSQAMVFLLKQK